MLERRVHDVRAAQGNQHRMANSSLQAYAGATSSTTMNIGDPYASDAIIKPRPPDVVTVPRDKNLYERMMSTSSKLAAERFDAF